MFDFDPAKLKLETKFAAELLKAQPKGNTALQKKRAKPAPNRFVQVPWLWVECLAKAKAGRAAFLVAMFLIYEAWRTKSRVVKLTNTALAELGIGRHGKTAALRQLRKAGLIAVEDRTGKSPLVTVRFIEMWRVGNPGG